MAMRPLHVIRGQLTGDAPLDTAVSRAILLRVTEGDLPETIQVGTPHRVLAFGKHDKLSDGFASALDIARRHDYDPTVRIAGGRAVVFSPTIVRFAWTVRADDPPGTMHQRYRELSEAVVRVLASFGIRGFVGEVPNEYCAGEYSVFIRGHRKVMGVGQRLTKRAAQVGGMIVVSDPDDINRVLVPIYAALGVPIDPQATGSLADDRAVDPVDVGSALVSELSNGADAFDTTIDEQTVELAARLRPEHDPAS